MNEDHHPVGRPSGERGAMIIDRAELRKRAEEATKGEWSMNRYSEPVSPDGKNLRAKGLALTNSDEANANSAYIVAAQPQVVLAILDRIEELEAVFADPALRAFEYKDRLYLYRQVTYHFGGTETVWKFVGSHDLPARKALSGEKP